VVERMARLAGEEPLVYIDYLEAVDAGEFQPVPILAGDILLAGAVFIGRTRLIDNREIRAE